MGPKNDDNGVILPNQIQKYPKSKINEIRKLSNDVPRQPVIEPTPQPEQKMSNSKQKATANSYLNQQEDMYNLESYDVGRYNLRKRGPQKKYYDDDIDFDEEPDMEPRRKMIYNDEYKVVGKSSNYGIAPGVNRRTPVESNFQGKQKRK